MPKNDLKKTVQLKAFQRIAEYILDCEGSEYDNYLNYCDELKVDPRDVSGPEQFNHIYALALIGLGYEFPNNNEDDEEFA